MKTRRRDLVASLLLCSLILPKWSGYGSESLQAIVDLSFYTEYKSHLRAHSHSHSDAAGGHESTHNHDYKVAKPEPFDLDGDGITEALVVPVQTNTTGSQQRWVLNVLDLKPIHSPVQKTELSSHGTERIPLYPEVIFTSNERGEVPIKIRTEQLILRPKQSYANDKEDPDPTRHYYCGTSWNDASDKCSVHCPKGLDSECPGDETCFADTSCRIREESTEEESQKHEVEGYAKTPNDGLPSIITLYSSGNITMHSVTKRKGDSMKGGLELIEMWSVNPFTNVAPSSKIIGATEWIDFVEVELLLEPNAPVGSYGVVAGTVIYYLNDDEMNEQHAKSTLYFALDAFSGDIIWRRHGIVKRIEPYATSNKSNEFEAGTRIPSELSVSSYHRRRSENGRVMTQVKYDNDVAQNYYQSEDCLHHYAQWLMNDSSQIFPHSFWERPSSIERGNIATDTKLASRYFSRGNLYHIELRNRRQEKKRSWVSDQLSSKLPDKPNPQRGRPNVLVFHNSHGVDVISLRNGQEVCHLSLLDNVLYSDFNNDGTIDQLQISTTNYNEGVKQEDIVKEAIPCEAYLQSGLGIKEQITSIPLCEQMRDEHQIVRERGSYRLSAASPLLIEGNGDISTRDIVFAMNNGLVRRYDIHGKLKWSIKANTISGIPAWNSHPDGQHQGYLSRIELPLSLSFASDSPAADILALRPIMLIGDDKLAVFTSGRGQLLASTTFPQVSLARPVLADMNGDGITDVLIMTSDGIWGYCIHITTRKSRVVSVMNTLVLVVIAFALLLHNYGDQKDKGRRSTDL